MSEKGHKLKTWPGPFNAMWIGQKRFEFRNDDRNFQEGDQLLLQEWDPVDEEYSGREISALITYVSRGPAWGIPVGFAVLSLKNMVRFSG